MRQEYSISYDTTVDVSALSILDNDEGDSPAGGIIAIIVIIGTLVFLYKKGKLSMVSKKLNNS